MAQTLIKGGKIVSMDDKIGLLDMMADVVTSVRLSARKKLKRILTRL